MLLLNGSVEVAGGYVYHLAGGSCDVNMMAVQANISIREGMPIGTVLFKWFCFMGFLQNVQFCALSALQHALNLQ